MSGTHGGNSSTSETWVLMYLFALDKIIRGLKFLGPKCGVFGLKFGEGKIIWGLIFLVCHCGSHFLSIKFVFLIGQVIIWGL